MEVVLEPVESGETIPLKGHVPAGGFQTGIGHVRLQSESGVCLDTPKDLVHGTLVRVITGNGAMPGLYRIVWR